MRAYTFNLQPESQEKFTTDQLKAGRSKDKKIHLRLCFFVEQIFPFSIKYSFLILIDHHIS